MNKLRTVSPSSIIATRLFELKNKISEKNNLSDEIESDFLSLIELAQGLDDYPSRSTTAESKELKNLNDETIVHDWNYAYKEKKSKSRLVTRMMSSHVSAQFLKMLVSISKPKKILEIGLFSGYSALAMAEALHDEGELISCEIEPYAAKFAQKHFDKNKHGKKIQIIIGKALDTLEKLKNEGYLFDFVFIDANKSEYPQYIKKLIKNKLINNNSLVCIDNVFLKGSTYSEYEKQSKSSKTVKKLNSELVKEQFFTVMVPLRDGITLMKLNN